jgi:C-terminal processing protease CtpA/Prc
MMKFKRAILSMAAACTLAIAGLAVAEPQSPVHDPTTYEREYNSMLDKIRLQYTGTDLAPAFWDQIKTRYKSGIDSPEALKTAIGATLIALGDNRVKLLSAADLQALELRARSAYIGVGVSLKKTTFVARSIVVKEVEADSTAEEAGLKPGDRITHINGESVDRKNYDKTVDKIRGEPGSVVNLVVDRDTACVSVPVHRDLDRRVGVTVKPEGEHNAFAVDYVRDKAPAQAAGLEKGDTIVAIDGTSTDAINLDQAVERIGNGSPGTNVTVKVERDGIYFDVTMTRDYLGDMSKATDLRGESTSYKPGFWHVQFKHLDWRTIDKDLGHLGAMFEDENQAVILDLRGAPGNEPDVAAKVASWFVKSGVVLRYDEGFGSDKITTTYEIKSGAIVKSFSGAKSGSETIALPDNAVVFSKRMIVLVDGNTTGTSEALAHALQSSGRATVTGYESAGEPTLTTLVRSSDESLVVQLPSRTLVNADGSAMGSVTPDTRVSWSDDIADYAKYQIDGEAWRLKPNFIPIVVGAMLVLFTLIVLLRSLDRKRTAKNESEGDTESSDADDETESTTDAHTTSAAVTTDASKTDATANGDDDNSRKSTKRKWVGQYIAMMLALLAFPAMLFGAKTLIDFRYRAPNGYHSEIIVTAYVGNDTIGKLQRKAVEELASEYSGDIKFSVIDIVAHPELATDPDWGKVKSVPAISVKRRGYHADGTTVKERSGVTSTPMTKRQIVDYIESMAKESRPFWSGPEIKRVRKTQP